VIAQLVGQEGMESHVANLGKLVDDLRLQAGNYAFNSDSDLTLTQTRAMQRASYIRAGSISYVAHIGFLPLSQSLGYTGLTEISFELTAVPKQLAIDFQTRQVEKLIVNGVATPAWLRGEYLVVPRVYLQLGVNRVTVHYSSDFDNDGLGCMAYTDRSSTAADRYYTYTQFEPHSAHRFLPCFDQPDLKARLTLSVVLPTDWVATSNTIPTFIGNYSQDSYLSNTPAMTETAL
jgi:aminopeptidase N